MRAIEFQGVLSREGQIVLPPELAGQIPAGKQLPVVILSETSDSDSAWRLAGRERFEAAYGPGDAVYEQLIDDPAAR